MHFNVTSPTTADAMMELLADSIQSTGDWTRKPGADPYRWEGELENRHVVMEFKTTASDTPDSFGIDVEINADEPRS